MIDPPKDLNDAADMIVRQIRRCAGAARSQAVLEVRQPSKKQTKVDKAKDATELMTWRMALALTLTGNAYELEQADAYVAGWQQREADRVAAL